MEVPRTSKTTETAWENLHRAADEVVVQFRHPDGTMENRPIAWCWENGAVDCGSHWELRDGREEAYLDGDPFDGSSDEEEAYDDARQHASLVLAALQVQLSGVLQHIVYPYGTLAITTEADRAEDGPRAGLALDPSLAAESEFTVHRKYGADGKHDVRSSAISA